MNLKELTKELNYHLEDNKKITQRYKARIFKIESKSFTTKTGSPMKKWLFYVNDLTGSVILSATIFNTKSEPHKVEFLDSLKEGDYVSFTGEAQKNNFTKYQDWNIEITQFKKPLTLAKDLETQKTQIFEPISENKTETLPRIEFLEKTKLSTYDSLMSVEDVIESNLKLGRKTIPFVDFQNVQAFPQIQNYVENYNKERPVDEQIKPIYGVTLNVSPDEINLTTGSTDLDFKNIENYVVYDIETTGLSANFNEIIEIGAVKYENGQKQTFQTFIKPTNPIPEHISKLTNITNEMVSDAPSEKEALEKFIDFIGPNKILAGHNILNFDNNVIAAKLKKHKINSNFDSIPKIDTLQLSRALLEQRNHTLNKFCSKMGVSYDTKVAHRADYDAEVNLEALKNLLKMEDLALFNIPSFNSINSQLQTPLLKSQIKYLGSDTFYLKSNDAIADFNKLVSQSLTTDFENFPSPRVKENTIKTNPSVQTHKILRTNGVHFEDEIFNCANNKDLDDLEKTISKYDFISLPPISNFSLEIAKKLIDENSLRQIYRNIIVIAKKLNKDIIAVSEASYFNTSDKQYFDILTSFKMVGGKAHRLFQTYETENGFRKQYIKEIPTLDLKTTEQLIQSFKWLEADFGPDFVKQICSQNTLKLAQTFENTAPMKRGLFTPEIDNCKEMLSQKVWKNAKIQYGDPLPEIVQKRIEKELDSILGNGFEVVYWVSAELVRKSNEDGYLVGSRGSVGSSLVATMLGITEVNPLPPHYYCSKCHHFDLNIPPQILSGYDLPSKQCSKCNIQLEQDGQNIPFETFLGFEGDKVPDIDLNFAGEYQPTAHNFLKEYLGSDKVFRAGTIGTIAEKTAFNEVEKYFQANNLQKQTSAAEIENIASHLIDIKRTTGQHPGGIIAVPKNYSIFDFSPINYPADDQSSDWYTTHHEFSHLHDNLLKFDILGHDDPTLLHHLERMTSIDPKTISIKDENIRKEVLALFNKFCYGLPEFGTKFARDAVGETSPKTFADLIALSGLLHGTDVYEGNIKEIIMNEGKTLSEVPSCRDNIMIDLIKKGIPNKQAFDIMEKVRKGKGLTLEEEQLMRAHNVDESYIRACKKIKYMFPKAHAAAYVLSAYRIAYFKKYYPEAFYSAWLSYKKGEFDLETIKKGKEAIEKEIKRISNDKNASNKEENSIPTFEVILEALANGIKIKNINLNKSSANDYIPDLENHTILPPFSAINGLGQEVAQQIIEQRDIKKFENFADFKSRTKLNKSQLFSLCRQDVISAQWRKDFFITFFNEKIKKTTLKNITKEENLVDLEKNLNIEIEQISKMLLSPKETPDSKTLELFEEFKATILNSFGIAAPINPINSINQDQKTAPSPQVQKIKLR